MRRAASLFLMTELRDIMDRELLLDMIEQGYVRKQVDETGLVILNYTEKAQFEKKWNEVTLQTRGLIIDSVYETVIARPFQKFFNWSEIQDNIESDPWVDKDAFYNEPVRVQDKMDGSLGIIFYHPYGMQWRIATRGSFQSEQAEWAQKRLDELLDNGLELKEGFTYLVEIIYPENRIVVDYGGLKALVLLDVLRNEDGGSVFELSAIGWPYGTANQYHYQNFGAVLTAPSRKGKEGFVVYWPQRNLRVKIKEEEYVRLHKIMTGVTPLRVWDVLRNGGTLEEWLKDVPDEFYAQIEEIAKNLKEEFDYVKMEAHLHHWAATLGLPKEYSRKEFALEVQHDRVPAAYRGAVFSIEDRKSIDDWAWKMVRPKGDTGVVHD